MPVTRRDALLGIGGGLVGLAASPLPWKLVSDVSVWTQHRRALAVPAAGEVSLRPAVCAVCPGGCAVRVRCVDGRPVATRAAGLARGASLCALGLTLHHLPFHPLRVEGPRRRVGDRLEPVALDAAVAQIASAAVAARRSGLGLMVLDRRPGRVVSEAWRELLAGEPGGVYAVPAGEGATLDAVAEAVEAQGPLGVDLERTGVVLSFGAPILEGWGRPGRLRVAREGLRVVQVEAWRSPSAALADEWIAVAPGAEGALALALAESVARATRLRLPDEVSTVLAAFAPSRAASRTGLSAERIEALARSLLDLGPAVAVGGGDPGGGPLGKDTEKAIALLDLALGAVGREGGILPRRSLPARPSAAPRKGTTALAEVAPASVGLVLLDGADDGRALPWPAIRRTLAPGALVASLSAFDWDLARHAGLLVPGPAPLEGWEEELPSPDAVVASYSLAAPVLQAPPGATDPVELARRLAAALGSQLASFDHEQRLRQRCAAIGAAGRGLVHGPGGPPEAAVPADPWDVLVAGGRWVDDPPSPGVPRVRRYPLPSPAARAAWLAPPAPGPEPVLVAFAARGVAGSTPVSPLLTKLYQESDLRRPASLATASPQTRRALGLVGADRVRLESAEGAVLALLRDDATLPPGQVALAAGPDARALHPGPATPGGALPLLEPSPDGNWRSTRVRVREA